MAHDVAASSHHRLDRAQAGRKPKIQPDRLADDLGREEVPGSTGAGGRRHAARLSFQHGLRQRERLTPTGQGAFFSPKFSEETSIDPHR